MALWGNKDNVTSTGTVSLDYSTGVVTGAGTSFSSDLSEGQVIRFGDRSGTYFGDAVIIGITSETLLTIGSTAGLSGASIASTDFQVSELPKYTVLDSSYSETLTTDPVLTPLTQTGTATTNSPVGFSTVYVAVSDFVFVGDFLLNDGNNIEISTVNDANIALASTISAGISTGDILTFKRYSNGYSKYVYGVADAGIAAAQGTSYALTHEGWVGVTTYMGVEGELRVKKEVLVAMSGITTGNTPLYPPA